MSIITKDKEFSDEEILAEYRKRSDEYHEWRQRKAAEFLQSKKRNKCYHCYTVETETGYEDEFFIPLADAIVARVQALKEEIRNDPELKDNEDRADEFSDRVCEIGYDIENVPQPWPDDNIFTNIDLDDYLYLYHFDIHLFDWKGDANGRLFPATADLTDEEYIDLLALLIDQPDCSFQHLAHLSPKFKAIHDKVSDYLHNYDFTVMKQFCHDHDYAIRMTELRRDAQTLLKQLKDNKEKYPYIGFLKDFMVNLTVIMNERNADKTSSQTATDDSSTDGTGGEDQQERLAKLADWIDQFTKGDNFLAADLLERELKRQIDKEKLRKPYPLLMEHDNLSIELPGHKTKKISFGRSEAKTLYIFFLRQIERANKDSKVSPYLSQKEMEDYADELRKIHEYSSGKKPFDLESWFKKSSQSNTFFNAGSLIRKWFGQFYNTEELKKNYGKCYSIEIMGKDRYGNPRYGIDLDIDDFDLGWYSIDRRGI